MGFNARIFVERTTTRYTFVDAPYNEFYQNPTKKVENTGKFHLYP